MIPQGWKQEKFGNVLLVCRGGAWGNESANPNVGILRTNNITDDFRLSFTEVVWREIPEKQLNSLQLLNGDIILTKSNSIERVGSCALFCQPMDDDRIYIAANFCQMLRFDKNQIDPEFGFYFLVSPNVQLELKARATGTSASLQNINGENLKAVNIYFPDLHEQKRIILRIKECMERVDEICVLQDEALKEGNSLFEAFVEAQIEPEWKWQSISEVITEIRNGWSWKESPTGQPTQVLRLSAVRNLSLNINEVRTVCLESRQSEEFSLKKEDVFMVRGNGSQHLVGRSAISTDDHPSIVFNDLLIRLRFTSEMLPEFANFMLHSRKVREQIEQVAKTAAGIWKINQTGICSLKLPCPSIEIQQEKLVALKEGLAASKQIVQHFSQTDTKALSDAILRKAFAGEL